MSEFRMLSSYGRSLVAYLENRLRRSYLHPNDPDRVELSHDERAEIRDRIDEIINGQEE